MKSAPAPVARSANAALPALVLLFNAFIWGTSWLPFRALREHGAHPLWSTVFVYVCGVALFLAWRPRVLGELARHPKLAALALAAGLTNICFNWAVTVGDVMRVVLLFYLMPAWSILLAWALLGERPTAGALLRLALALAGVTLVLKKPGMAWPWPESQADWLAIAGGFSFALTGVLLRRWRGTPATARTFAMFLGSAIVSAGAALLTGNLALQYGTAHLPAQTASLIMLAEVVFASVSSVALGAAALATGTLAGGAMILSAALLAVLMRR